MKKDKKDFVISIKLTKRTGHHNHRSGSGQHDSRPKRERTRNSQNRKSINDSLG